MLLTRNKYDTENVSLLNKLVEFGGDIEYTDLVFKWHSYEFLTVNEMKEFMEQENGGH